MLVTPRFWFCCSVASVAVAAISTATATIAVDRLLNDFQRVIVFLLQFWWCGLRDLSFALLNEREQVPVDEIGMRGGQSVREARIVDFARAFDQLCRLFPRILDGNDLVVLAVHDQRRDVELLEVVGV